jgi:predicted MPP superfamily phosphohydrolase
LSSFPTRRKFLQLSAAGAALGTLAVAGDGTLFEANRPQLVSIDVPLPRLADSFDGFRIAQLSDLHYDDHFSVVPLRKAIDIVNGLNPDVVVVTGDFVTAAGRRFRKQRLIQAKAIEPCAQMLAQLRARFSMLGVLGNHDVDTDPNLIIEVLQSHDIQILRNRAVSVERDGRRLWLAGVDDVLRGKAKLDLALQGIPTNEPVVLLAHEPDWADYVTKFPVDLQLSGHSHGGQIRVPILGPPYLPPLAKKYPRGLRQIGRLTLYTNVGVGTIVIPMRFDCPPEVTLITLRKAPVGVAT